MIKTTTFSLLLFINLISYSQEEKNLNDYKYIIVQNHFDFLKKPDQFQTSSLTKFLFKKNGFIVFFKDEEYPKDLKNDRCLALYASVKDNSNMIYTKSQIVLKDCKNNIILTTKNGRSKKKEYKKAYHETIRKSFETIKQLNYIYKPQKKESKIKAAIVKSNATKNSRSISKQKQSIAVISKKEPINTLYAQSKKNGFQLINAVPEIVFQLLKTSVKDFFIIKDKNGVLYKNDTYWIAEFYEDTKLVKKEYKIKF